jgi:hypothetical protein
MAASKNTSKSTSKKAPGAYLPSPSPGFRAAYPPPRSGVEKHGQGQGGAGQDGEEGGAQGRARAPRAQGAHVGVVPPAQDTRAAARAQVPAQEHPARAADGPVPDDCVVRRAVFVRSLNRAADGGQAAEHGERDEED